MIYNFLYFSYDFLVFQAEYPVHIRTNPLYVTTLVQEKALPAETSALLNSVQNVFGAIDTFLKTLKTNKINIAVQGKTSRLNFVMLLLFFSNSYQRIIIFGSILYTVGSL